MKYLNKFFEEKDVEEKVFEINHKNEKHLISTERVIELIKTAPEHEQEKIADTLRRIDFKNGSVIDYLKHLAEGFIKVNY